MNHSPNTEQRERAAFEADVAESMIGSMNTARRADGEYIDPVVEDHWQTWQTAWEAASATQAAPALPEPRKLDDKIRSLDPAEFIAPASPNTGAVPDGWQLVPKVPTPGMLAVYKEFHRQGRGYMDISVYKAMLAATPATPSPSKGGEADSAAEDTTGKDA